MKKVSHLLLTCIMLLVMIVSSGQVYAAETNSNQGTKAVKNVHVKSGMETTIYAGTEKNSKVVWKVRNVRDPKTKEKIVNVKELEDGGLLIQGLLPGTCNITAKTENGTYQYKVIVHTHGFQRKTSALTLHGVVEVKNCVWEAELFWRKVKGADGYIVYSRPPGCKVFHKLKVLKGENQTSWTRRIKVIPRYDTYGIKAYKVTKAGITVYTPLITG